MNENAKNSVWQSLKNQNELGLGAYAAVTSDYDVFG